jgi:hypothetical protein
MARYWRLAIKHTRKLRTKMKLKIHWTFILNSTKEKVVTKMTKRLTSKLNVNRVVISKSEIYWKDKTKYALEIEQNIEELMTLEQTVFKLIETINLISSNWNITIVGFTKDHFHISAVSNDFSQSELYWAGVESELLS